AKVLPPPVRFPQGLLDDAGRIELPLEPVVEPAAHQEVEVRTELLRPFIGFRRVLSHEIPLTSLRPAGGRPAAPARRPGAFSRAAPFCQQDSPRGGECTLPAGAVARRPPRGGLSSTSWVSHRAGEHLATAGKARMAAVGACMRKLLIIAYGVLKNCTPFDPSW